MWAAFVADVGLCLILWAAINILHTLLVWGSGEGGGEEL